MSNGGDLLRMLMPAVSPVPTQGVRSAKPPIESLSFDSLLEDARQPKNLTDTQPVSSKDTDPPTQGDGVKQADQSTRPNVLAQLNGIEAIQNASLRRIVADAAGR